MSHGVFLATTLGALAPFPQEDMIHAPSHDKNPGSSSVRLHSPPADSNAVPSWAVYSDPLDEPENQKRPQKEVHWSLQAAVLILQPVAMRLGLATGEDKD